MSYYDDYDDCAIHEEEDIDGNSYCSWCDDCRGCENCDCCDDCSSGFELYRCQKCNTCNYCDDCYECRDCDYCDRCVDCDYCYCCDDCEGCYECWACDKLKDADSFIANIDVNGRKIEGFCVVDLRIDKKIDYYQYNRTFTINLPNKTLYVKFDDFEKILDPIDLEKVA